MAVVAFAFLGVHLANLPETLEDIDSVNFALGVERFDPSAHQPHPPGYPIYVALARISTQAVGAVRPGWDRDHRAAAGLAVLGAIAGALAIYVFAAFWTAAGLAPPVAFFASLVAITSPLFWLTAGRPLSDAAGLVATVAVQAMLIRSLRTPATGRSELTSAMIAAAAMTGLVIGFRSQAMWLTGPLFAWLLVRVGRWRAALTLVGAASLGVLAWAVPLLWLSGGITKYWMVLAGQGADDFLGPHMLAVSLTWARFRDSMAHTFVDPWDLRTFGHIVSVLALIGGARLFWRQRSTFVLAVVAFAPYLLFHLAFQETVTTRYALPMIVPVSALVVVALAALGTRAGAAGAVVIAAASLVIGAPRLSAYAHDGSPVFRGLQQMQRTLPASAESPVLQMHHQVWWGVRRALDWYRPVWDTGAMPFPGDRERLSVVEHFRSGGTSPVWFLGFLSRTDMAAFDPRTTTLVGHYEFPAALRRLIGGARVVSFDWWSIRQPGWMLGSGWSLTPELAGVTAEDRTRQPTLATDAFLRRGPGPRRVLVGGRYLGPDGGAPVRVVVTLDGAKVTEWMVASEPRWFVQWIDIPDIARGDGAYATLSVQTSTVDGGGVAAPVGFEQFDAAPASEPIAALTTGWQEREEDPSTGLSWRWTTASGAIQVVGPPRDATLRLSGDSPLKYFDAAPEVTVRAGARVLDSFRPAAEFSRTVVLPADALAQSNGVVTIATSRTFSPSDQGSPDRRVLGLRLFSLDVR